MSEHTAGFGGGLMNLDHGPECVEDPCDYCTNRAEERAEGWGHEDDWQLGQTQYERHLDRMGEA